jgi:predicted small secreted protein
MKAILIVAAAALIAGCNTMRGIGEDVIVGGEKVEGVFKKDGADTDTTSATPSSDVATSSDVPSDGRGRSSEKMSPSGPAATQAGRVPNKAGSSAAAANERNSEVDLQSCKRTDDPQNCIELVKGAFRQM